MTGSGRTVEEIAGATRWHAVLIAEILADEVERGQVERCGEVYSLSASAERRFGRDLRGIAPPKSWGR